MGEHVRDPADRRPPVLGPVRDPGRADLRGLRRVPVRADMELHVLQLRRRAGRHDAGLRGGRFVGIVVADRDRVRAPGRVALDDAVPRRLRRGRFRDAVLRRLASRAGRPFGAAPDGADLEPDLRLVRRCLVVLRDHVDRRLLQLRRLSLAFQVVVSTSKSYNLEVIFLEVTGLHRWFLLRRRAQFEISRVERDIEWLQRYQLNLEVTFLEVTFLEVTFLEVTFLEVTLLEVTFLEVTFSEVTFYFSSDLEIFPHKNRPIDISLAVPRLH